MNAESNVDAYERRIKRVIGYICSHLEQELSVEHLAEIAGFSKFHFHRQFTNYAGISVGQFVRLTRLKRAAYQLAFDTDKSILAVALDAGFFTAESFARAFKEVNGQTPSAFRRSAEWRVWTSQHVLPGPIRTNNMQPNIVKFEATRVAVLEHRGSPESLMLSVGRFVQWRKGCSDSPVASNRTFGISYEDPETVEPSAFRFDICGELKQRLSPNDVGVVEKLIPCGRCAVLRHVGSTDAITETLLPLFTTWLPQSGEELRDFPCFFHYIERMPSVQEHQQVTDIYVPLRDREPDPPAAV